jgi:hypothetical protein
VGGRAAGPPEMEDGGSRLKADDGTGGGEEAALPLWGRQRAGWGKAAAGYRSPRGSVLCLTLGAYFPKNGNG